MKVFTIYDAKVEEFTRPFFHDTHGSALRLFEDTINGSGDTMFSKHPEDFALWYVGEFDTEKGILEPATPLMLTTAMAALSQAENRNLRLMGEEQE